MNKKCREMKDLADMTVDHPLLNELGLWKFFQSKITEPGSEHVYPLFHGIPKIHKKPTGFRPIIPCHSVVFNPAAKFVSKELKPLIKATPSIIHGTKDLFTRLSQLKIDSRKQWYFVSGDVVAFYPNVPLSRCIEIILNMYSEWLLDNARVDPTSEDYEAFKENLPLKLEIFKRAIEIGGTQLITQHGKRYFEQLNGLAMGVADSPDLANLFAAFFERSCEALADPRVIFYGRYIDDCFALVYAETADIALNLLSSSVKYDGCTIEWNVSDSKCQFLDAELYQEKGKLEWRPFVKAGNHRERLPWVSHHPIDVLRGVYIGECSRLSVLCSNKENYIGAIRDLNALYLTRGYPEQLVTAWCRKNISERWEKRFTLRTQPEHDEGVLVLKTRYDDVWNWFSATELGEAVSGYWSEWYTRFEEDCHVNDPSRPFPAYDPEMEHDLTDVHPKLFAVRGEPGSEVYVPDLRKIGILGRRWIVSRKRNTNLFDLSNVWKKTVFRKLDEAIADEGGVDVGVSTRIPSMLDEYEDNLLHTIAIESDDELILHRRDSSPEQHHPEFGRISKTHNR
jgi:hypothetical protein